MKTPTYVPMQNTFYFNRNTENVPVWSSRGP